MRTIRLKCVKEAQRESALAGGDPRTREIPTCLGMAQLLARGKVVTLSLRERQLVAQLSSRLGEVVFEELFHEGIKKCSFCPHPGKDSRDAMPLGLGAAAGRIAAAAEDIDDVIDDVGGVYVRLRLDDGIAGGGEGTWPQPQLEAGYSGQNRDCDRLCEASAAIPREPTTI